MQTLITAYRTIRAKYERRGVKPLVYDLFAGLFGWGAGLVAEGWRVIGYDLQSRAAAPEGCEMRLRDVVTIHGSELADADLIVASPPCQEYSHMAMPWKRSKQIAKALRGQDEFPKDYKGSRTVAELNALFDACFRIQREASEAAGRHIPMVIENVKGAQLWVGRARWHYGSYFLWGDVPAVMPWTPRLSRKDNITALTWLQTTILTLKDNPLEWETYPCIEWPFGTKGRGYGTLYRDGKLRGAHREAWEIVNGPIAEGVQVLHKCDNPPCIRPVHLFTGSNADNLRDCSEKGRMHPGEDNPGAKLSEAQVCEIRARLSTGAVQRHLAQEFGVSVTAIWEIAHGLRWNEGSKNNGGSWFNQAHNTESGHGQNPVNGLKLPEGNCRPRRWEARPIARLRDAGVKQPGHSGRAWFADPDVAGHFSSKSSKRAQASAEIAKIPFALASHIARVFKPAATAPAECSRSLASQ